MTAITSALNMHTPNITAWKMFEIVGNHILGSFSSVASDIVPLNNFDTEPKRGPATVAIPEKVHLFYKKMAEFLSDEADLPLEYELIWYSLMTC